MKPLLMFNHSFRQVIGNTCIENTARFIEKYIYRRFHNMHDRDCFGVFHPSQ